MAKKNAPTTKVSNWIEDGGLEIELSNGVILVADYVETQWFETIDAKTGEEIFDSEDAHYTISSHQGYMPAFHTEKFDTLQELANAMRRAADLRSWRPCILNAEM